MNGNRIMPHRIARPMIILLPVGILAWKFLKKLAKRWLISATPEI